MNFIKIEYRGNIDYVRLDQIEFVGYKHILSPVTYTDSVGHIEQVDGNKQTDNWEVTIVMKNKLEISMLYSDINKALACISNIEDRILGGNDD